MEWAGGSLPSLQRALGNRAFGQAINSGALVAPSLRGMSRAIGNHAVQQLVQTKRSVTSPVPTAAAQNSSPMIQRMADPTKARDVLRVIISGTANFGVYIMKQGNDTVAVKFSREDTRRAAFADKVLGAAGVGNTDARVASSGEVATIIANITQIAQRYQRSPFGNQNVIGATILANIGNADKAKSVLLMNKAEGEDFFDVLADPNSDKSFLNTPTFHRQLGKLVTADALLGNSDRLAVLTRKEKKSKSGKVIAKANEWALLNAANFKVTADGVIHTIDNDTEIAGRQLLKRLGTVTTPEAWAEFLIGGGEEHIAQRDTRATERHTPPLESLFNPWKRQLMYEALVEEAKAQKVQGSLTVDFGTFDTRFSAGIMDALTGITQQISALKAQAAQIGGGDAGGGLIDPEAFELKARYLKDRMGGTSANEAASLMLFRIKSKDMLKFKSEFLGVPTVPLEAGKLTKVGRALTFNTKIDKAAEALKEQARAPGVDAATLKQAEAQLDAMVKAKATGEEPDRRVFKAIFEAKCQRMQLYLQDTNNALTALEGGRKGPSPEGEWLRELNFATTLDANYKSGVSVWIDKLNKIGETGRIAAINTSIQTLVNTAGTMERTM